MAKTLNRLLFMVDRFHVFKRLAEENDLSGAQDVAGLTINSLQRIIRLGIIISQRY